jgi:hypothetical protein
MMLFTCQADDTHRAVTSWIIIYLRDLATPLLLDFILA